MLVICSVYYFSCIILFSDKYDFKIHYCLSKYHQPNWTPEIFPERNWHSREIKNDTRDFSGGGVCLFIHLQNLMNVLYIDRLYMHPPLIPLLNIEVNSIIIMVTFLVVYRQHPQIMF